MKKYRYNGQDQDCCFTEGDICTREGSWGRYGNGTYVREDGYDQIVLDECMEEVV